MLVGKNAMKQVRPDAVDSGAQKEAFCTLAMPRTRYRFLALVFEYHLDDV